MDGNLMAGLLYIARGLRRIGYLMLKNMFKPPPSVVKMNPSIHARTVLATNSSSMF
ncbi:hypothetical protein BDDG_12791 [Blastomyces dermatitidis ATCC 18188]|uniref:Uncharacterized protein n=1 Tax=Ajellomyces dermatitidis (strain ATCC 18188 / CBS 674.68) TaxID=653446 RepID=A0A0J9ET82_AJEDA|nr:hypothetical protein BDDG_12791 [Blastomyces dermatitidis ATCC 18188]